MPPSTWPRRKAEKRQLGAIARPPVCGRFSRRQPERFVGHRQQSPPAASRQRRRIGCQQAATTAFRHAHPDRRPASARHQRRRFAGCRWQTGRFDNGIRAALTGVDAPGGFAVPMDDIMRRIVDVLLRGEEVEYGFLGISTSIVGGRRHGTGIEISTVIPNSPAQRAGLEYGDIILKVNERAIHDRDDLFLCLPASLAGRPADIVIQRRFGPTKDRHRESRQDADRYRSRKKSAPQYASWHIVGQVSFLRRVCDVEYTSIIKGEKAIPLGVLVRDVEGQAKTAGLIPYSDIIVRVNDEPVNSAGRVLPHGQGGKLP